MMTKRFVKTEEISDDIVTVDTSRGDEGSVVVGFRGKWGGLVIPPAPA